MKKGRRDRFVWKEGEVQLYDMYGNLLDPKTMTPLPDGNGSDAIKQKLPKDKNADSVTE